MTLSEPSQATPSGTLIISWSLNWFKPVWTRHHAKVLFSGTKKHFGNWRLFSTKDNIPDWSNGSTPSSQFTWRDGILTAPDGLPLDRRPPEGSEQLTALQEACRSVLNLLGQLTCALQVVEDEDVGGEQHHVLLPAAVRHGQELVQVLGGPTHQVTCRSNRRKMRQMKMKPCQDFTLSRT